MTRAQTAKLLKGDAIQIVGIRSWEGPGVVEYVFTDGKVRVRPTGNQRTAALGLVGTFNPSNLSLPLERVA